MIPDPEVVAEAIEIVAIAEVELADSAEPSSALVERAEGWSRRRINQGFVRFRNLSPSATEQDHDVFTDRVVSEIARTGEASFGGTTWQGRRCVRVSLCGWRSNESDVDATISAVASVLGAMRCNP